MPSSMVSHWKKIRITLLTLGTIVLLVMVYKIGPGIIFNEIKSLGFALIIIFIPYLISYSFDTLGWKATLGLHKKKISFISLFLARCGGEAVNYLTPFAFVGGEPVKAYILRRFNIPLVEGLASVVIAKTTLVIAEIIFIMIGLILAVFKIEGSGPLLSVSLLLLLGGMVAVGLFLLAQKRGLFMGTLSLLERFKISFQFLKAREEKIRALDQSISEFYNHDKKGFYWSLSFFLIGWFAGAFEIYALLYFLGIPIGISEAIIIEAIASIVKSAAFFIPGAIGAQEGGNLLIFAAFGLAASTAITFSLVRRIREILLIGGGLLVLSKYEIKFSSESPLSEEETSAAGI